MHSTPGHGRDGGAMVHRGTAVDDADGGATVNGGIALTADDHGPHICFIPCEVEGDD